MEQIISLAKRLADYCRMTIKTGRLRSDSPIGIAYRDFMKEWDAKKSYMICKCGTGMELTTWSCPKCMPNADKMKLTRKADKAWDEIEEKPS